MKRHVFRFALATLALYGCAAVLGIDDIPEPDAVDSGIADGTTPPIDAPVADTHVIDVAIPDGAPPDDADAGIADADAGITDAGADADVDAGVVIIVIQPTTGFDPSAVFWNTRDHCLYIADNSQPLDSGSPSGAIWLWTDDEDAGPGSIADVLLSNGERFGQLDFIYSDSTLVIPAHAGSTGHVYTLGTNNEISPDQGSNAIFAVADSPTPGVFATGRSGNVTSVDYFSETNGVISNIATIPDASVGLVVHDDGGIFVATSAGIVRFRMGSTTGAKTASAIPDAGYMVDGPDGSFFVGSDGFIRLVAGSTVSSGASLRGKPFQYLGAFAYDAQQNRIFVPQGAVKDAGGSVLVIPLASP